MALLGDLILPLYKEHAKILLCTKQYGSKKATVVILWCQPSKETKLSLGPIVLSFTIYVKHVKRKELILKFRKHKFSIVGMELTLWPNPDQWLI